jgi:Ca2+-binding EF-hand superfamily protein
MNERIHFLFNMYDVSHDNTVSKAELATLINHGTVVCMYVWYAAYDRTIMMSLTGNYV